MGRLLRNPAILAVSLGHMTIDILSTSLPIFLVLFAIKLGLSNAGVGTVATVYGLAASITQPLFGMAADRWNTRWLGIGGLLFQAAAFVLAAVLPGYAALAAFAVAGLGSAAYHPQGAMNARRAAGRAAASGTSLFFFFGLTGHAIGPVLAGLLVAHLPLRSAIFALTALVIPVALLLVRYAPHAGRPVAEAGSGDGEHSVTMAWAPLALVAFVLVLCFLAFPLAATSTFLPKWLADAGFSSQSFGGLLSAYMIASAFGNVFGGVLADRWSRKGTVVLALALAPIPFYALYHAPSIGLGTVLAAALAGFAAGMPQSVLILMGQNLFPRRMGFGSGMVLGLFFGVNALGAWLTGWLADQIGLGAALLLTPWMCVVAALWALLLPRTRPRPQPVVAVLATSD